MTVMETTTCFGLYWPSSGCLGNLRASYMHDSPRSCRDALSKKCYGIHKTGQNKKRSRKERTIDLWNTRRKTQIQTKLD